VAYIHFAVENPTHYQLMFGKGVFNWSDHPGLRTAGSAAFGEVVKIIQICQQEKKIKPGAPLELAYVAWAAAHGLSSLLIDGRIKKPYNVDELAHLTIQTLLEGLRP
jgi:hypothetical protein